MACILWKFRLAICFNHLQHLHMIIDHYNQNNLPLFYLWTVSQLAQSSCILQKFETLYFEFSGLPFPRALHVILYLRCMEYQVDVSYAFMQPEQLTVASQGDCVDQVDFSAIFYKGNNLLLLPVWVLALLVTSEHASTLKRKYLLPRRENSLLLE